MKLLLYTFFAIILTQISQPPRAKYAIDLDRANKHIFTIPDSAQIILDELEDDYETMIDFGKAIYGHYIVKLADRKFDPSVLRNKMEYINYSLNYFKENKRHSLLAFTYYYLSGIYKKDRDFKNAIKMLLICKEIAPSLNEGGLYAGIYFNLSDISFQQKDYEAAEKYAIEAVSYFENENNKRNLAHMIVLLGSIYLEAGKLQEALQATQKGLEVSEDEYSKEGLLQNLGYYYYHINKNDSALLYLHESLSYPSEVNNYSSQYNLLAKIYFNQHEFDKAKAYADSVLANPFDIYQKKEAHNTLARISMELNDQPLFDYQTKLEQECQDSINKIEFQPHYDLIEKIHILENQYFEQKEERIRSIKVWSLIFFPTCIFLVFLFLKQKKKRHEANLFKHILLKKEESLDQSYSLLIKDIQDDISRAKDRIVKEKNSFSEKEIKIRNAYDKLLHFSDEQAFISKMNHILNTFPKKLMNKYPDLNFKEILWCCFFMLQIPTNDISLIMEYKQASLYKFKQRLIKKTGHTNTAEFEEMLLNLINA